MNEGEERFKRLLTDKNVKYEVKQNIRIYTTPYKRLPIRIQPDLYLTDYKIYCEIITWHPPDRKDDIKLAFERGYKITYYHDTGIKYKFNQKVLNEIGLNDNSQLFSIPELIDYNLEYINKIQTLYYKLHVKMIDIAESFCTRPVLISNILS